MATPPNAIRFDARDVEGLRDPDGFLGNLNAFALATQESLAQGLTFAKHFAGEVRTVELTAPDDWRPVTFASGWADWGDPSVGVCAVRVAADGVTVEARGLVKNTGAPLGNMVKVPGGFESVETGIYPSVAANAPAAIIVRTSGWVEALSGSLAAWFSLGGVCWALKGPPPDWEQPFSFALKEGFPGKPQAVLVLAAVDKVTGLTVGCGVPAWTGYSNRIHGGKDRSGVSIRRVPGLVPGRKYALTLLVLGG